MKIMKGVEKHQQEINSSDLTLAAKNKALEKELKDLKNKIADITLELQLALGISSTELGDIAEELTKDYPGPGKSTMLTISQHIALCVMETSSEPDSACNEVGSPQRKSVELPAVSEQEPMAVTLTEEIELDEEIPEPLEFCTFLSQMPFKKYVPGKFKRRRPLQLLEAIVEVDEEELDSTNNDFPTGQFKICQEIPKPQKQHSYIPQMPMTQLKVRSPNTYRPNQKLSSPTMFTDAEKINSYIPRMPITQLKVRRPSFDRPISIPGTIMETQHGASTSQNLLH
ncbi:hypothetical protein AMECASPLE_029871 [Ameca splendens]|uniref:Uncharacterized protein n=1 Tax=Ameca splendens TaxID=208324 RepID=A0ABV0Y668_9TELE